MPSCCPLSAVIAAIISFAAATTGSESPSGPASYELGSGISAPATAGSSSLSAGVGAGSGWCSYRGLSLSHSDQGRSGSASTLSAAGWSASERSGCETSSQEGRRSSSAGSSC